uniref:Ribonuclease n=1 Tax=Amphora coffeiformis TaxID=265554 RepID=A0A7S3L3Z4_9STRA
MTTSTVVTTTVKHHHHHLRSSRRLRGLPAELHAAASDDGPVPGARNDHDDNDMSGPNKPLKKARRSLSKTVAKPQAEKQSAKASWKDGVCMDCLPRTREKALLGATNNDDASSSSSSSSTVRYVLGVDEAGRGPLAGPVVAAAVWLPVDISGIIDSKKITSEPMREALYEQIMQATLESSSSTNQEIKWAVAIVNAQCIDKINILQATLLGMRMSLQALMSCPEADLLNKSNEATVTMPGTYVVTNQNKNTKPFPPDACYALIDGNRLPADLPCPGETIVKGDGREYAIAAASILAKVTRDRLMHGYDVLYPAYGLAQHKGYPTAAHMAAVHTHGASPIHRRTFAPLKHWEFDANGKIVGDKKVAAKSSSKTKKGTTIE